MKTITVKIPESLERELENLARKRHVSRSAVLREALNGLAGQRKRSAADLAGELVGALRGAPNLSSAPKYMRGYGE